MTPRSYEVTKVAERILEQMCDMTGEKTTLHNPKTKTHKIMVLIADRLALWVSNVTNDKLNKPEKKIIPSKEKSIEEPKTDEDKTKEKPQKASDESPKDEETEHPDEKKEEKAEEEKAEEPVEEEKPKEPGEKVKDDKPGEEVKAEKPVEEVKDKEPVEEKKDEKPDEKVKADEPGKEDGKPGEEVKAEEPGEEVKDEEPGKEEDKNPDEEVTAEEPSEDVKDGEPDEELKDEESAEEPVEITDETVEVKPDQVEKGDELPIPEEVVEPTEIPEETSKIGIVPEMIYHGPGSAFRVKLTTGSTLEVTKISSGTVTKTAAEARGVKPPRQLKVPTSESPINLKSAQEWVDWMTHVGTITDEWGEWLDNMIANAEKQVTNKDKAGWEQVRGEAQTDANKWTSDKQRIYNTGKMWANKSEKNTEEEDEKEIKSTDL